MDKVCDARTETYIPIPIDKNERVIWDFTIGIPIKVSSKNEVDKVDKLKYRKNFENAIYQITEEITKITQGLTYEYCYGTWVKENIHDNMHDTIERDLSVRISVIVLPEISDNVYNLTKNIISKVNKIFELGIIHVQAMKSVGSARHFIV